MEFIDELAALIYKKENIDRANEYVVSRGIDPNQLKFPYAYTSSIEAHFWRFKKKYPPYMFVDSLYIPIVDVRNDKRLIGFDIRYGGESHKRTRWHKFKRNDDDILIYNFDEFKKNLERDVIVVESAIDVETIRSLSLNINVISLLTAVSNLRSVLFLYAMAEKVYYLYDNDSSGGSAIKRVLKHISFDTDIMSHFTFISYRGKDVNESLKVLGYDYLRQTIESQIS